MPARMYLAALAATIAVLAGAIPAAVIASTPVQHTVSLKATERQHAWVSPQRLPDNRPLNFSIWVKGRELKNGHVEGKCRYTLFSRRLALELNACARTVGGKINARSAIAIRYIGSTRFRFRYWVGPALRF